MVGERILEELAEDERLVQSLPFVLDCWDESLGINVCGEELEFLPSCPLALADSETYPGNVALSCKD